MKIKAKFTEKSAGLIFCFLLMLCALPVMALKSSQDRFAGTEWYQRIGHGNDSTQAYMYYMNFYGDQDGYYVRGYLDSIRVNHDFVARDSMYHDWRLLMNLAPYVDYRFYIGSWFENFLIPLIDGGEDRAVKLVYFSDLMGLTDRLITDRTNLNSLRHLLPDVVQKYGTDQTDGVARVNKAHYYYTVGKKYFDGTRVYDIDSAYIYYKDAFNAFQNENITSSVNKELQAAFLVEYFNTSLDLYNSNREKYYEQFLSDYIDVIAACDRCLDPIYNEQDSVKRINMLQETGYDWAKLQQIEPAFKASGAGDPEKLNAYFASQLDEHRKDNEYLKKAIRIMDTYRDQKAEPTQVYYDYCEASYNIQPDLRNCLGMALQARKLNMLDDQVAKFNQAETFVTDPCEKLRLEYHVAMMYISAANNCKWPTDEEGNRVSAESQEYANWSRMISRARTYLENIMANKNVLLNANRVLDDREIPSIAAYYLGRIYSEYATGYFAKRQNNVALQELKTARSEFVTCINLLRSSMHPTFQIASGNGAGIEDNVIWCDHYITLAKKAIAKAKQPQKKYNAEYQEYLRKKKAEDDFWAGRR